MRLKRRNGQESPEYNMETLPTYAAETWRVVKALRMTLTLHCAFDRPAYISVLIALRGVFLEQLNKCGCAPEEEAKIVQITNEMAQEGKKFRDIAKAAEKATQPAGNA